MTQPLLIEIGVEELPAVPLLKIVSNIKKSWEKILIDNQLTSEFEFIYTPRRLVLKHTQMPIRQADTNLELMGPPIVAAFKDGEPTKAAIGFAKKCGVPLDEIGRANNNGREVLYFNKEQKGLDTTELLPAMVESWVESMSFGKMMRWGLNSKEFIRPIRWLQVRLGENLVDVELFGVKSSNKTFVHRMVNYDAIEINSIDDYENVLKNGAVTLYPNERESKILDEFEKLELEYNISIERDEELLAEVVAITENPKVLIGSFDEIFLELPPEVIITSMKEHQRYFPVFENGKILNKFVVVSNAYTDDYTKVIEGNERVLKPRLADGLFFYRNDLKSGLKIDGLEKVQFIDGLGTLTDKIDRENIIASKLLDLYIDKVKNATSKSNEELKELLFKSVTLAKADLMSEMVYEFTELQGLMGYYYAKELGEESLVYNAIKEQYMPVGEGAELPSSLFSAIVAMSIKLDTLIGLFSVGKIPTGSKDPFALRRAVNGVVRIVTQYDLPFNIDRIIYLLKSEYNEFDTGVLYDFIMERINKSLNANPSVIASVIASGEKDINEISKKVEALNNIVNSDSFKDNFSTFKRVANISKDIDLTGELNIDESLFAIEAENNLYSEYIKIVNKTYNDYSSKLNDLFMLKGLLDSYFNDVMVNVEDNLIKTNRLNTIGSIYKTFRDVADIKEISI